jgi:hypothetical protein
MKNSLIPSSQRCATNGSLDSPESIAAFLNAAASYVNDTFEVSTGTTFSALSLEVESINGIKKNRV